MPKALENQLKRQATAEGLEGDRKDAYVYGTLRKTGWTPERERRAKHMVKALRQPKR